MRNAEPYAALQVVDPNIRLVVAQEAPVLDRTAHQLSVLSNTYPGWDIGYDRDSTGQVRWTAELRRIITLDMVKAGVVRYIRQPDAIALAATLAWQSSLVHNGRAHNDFGK